MSNEDPFADQRLVRDIHRQPEAAVSAGTWPASIPAIDQILSSGLELGPGVTFLVGENGSGKSTLIEAVAAAYGLGPEGGTIHSAHETRPTESPLGDWIRLTRRPGAPRWGFFLRAETMHGYYTFQDSLQGGADFHSMSHGESFLAVVETYLSRPGFYCLDEPEAALSFSSTLALIGSFADLVANGSQVLCATHSPVLASLPGATIYELSDTGIERAEWEDLDLVTHWRSYLDTPQRYLRHILD
ncbi:putative ATPase [Okibacterium sp. HSC-33S16]|uniref:AAA family ATPase n=1 Tax=Okibacterium sp. HSC-33S16 TaxID=2910965 RepID=UPI00209D9642|nr:AAA family ATPase [Okibacterium sp. HSC-33S16]MCP2030652.1 putative ATPase [Okibacterium sp. HSC-33S16]